MDVLLSLPILSYFFSTSLTSWSTSLNLLFFYITWSTLVLSHSPLKIEIAAVAALRTTLWLIPSLLFLAFDTLLPSLSENIKYNGPSALPPRNIKSLAKFTSLALFNLGLETALEAGISISLATLLKTPVFRTSTTLPLPWQMFKHIITLFTAREILTYSIHCYLLHGQPLPSLFLHKPPTTSSTNLLKKLTPGKSTSKPTSYILSLHTRYTPHSRSTAPFSLLLKTDHPLPHLLLHFLPLYLPSVALSLLPPSLSLGSGQSTPNLHLLTYLLFVALTTLEQTLSHSGYTVVPGFVMGGIARRTAAHYASRGEGNFGSWGVLDWMCGTGVGGADVMGALKGEMEKHGVGGKNAEQKAGDVGSLVREGVEAVTGSSGGGRGKERSASRRGRGRRPSRKSVAREEK
ncbi:hypothetical protein VTI74DRAFT_10428 [Chaetomium olivicolor]